MEERTWSCICHRITDPPCWWCWWIEECDNPYLGDEAEPDIYDDLEEKYDGS